MAPEVKAAFLAVATFCVLVSAACGGSNKPTASNPTTEMQQYAKAMESWWSEASNGQSGEALVVPDGLDANRIQEADSLASTALPKVDAPSSIAAEHDLLVTALFGWDHAEGQAEEAGLYAGLAAAFCNPRSSGIEWIPDWRAVEALQSWRDSKEPCRDVDRWAGNWVPGRAAAPKPDYTHYQWGCGNDPADFQVYGSDVEAACKNSELWRRALQSAAQVWTEKLTSLCVSKLPTLYPSVSDALTSCR
jgi:hypothetical protein